MQISTLRENKVKKKIIKGHTLALFFLQNATMLLLNGIHKHLATSLQCPERHTDEARHCALRASVRATLSGNPQIWLFSLYVPASPCSVPVLRKPALQLSRPGRLNTTACERGGAPSAVAGERISGGGREREREDATVGSGEGEEKRRRMWLSGGDNGEERSGGGGGGADGGGVAGAA